MGGTPLQMAPFSLVFYLEAKGRAWKSKRPDRRASNPQEQVLAGRAMFGPESVLQPAWNSPAGAGKRRHFTPNTVKR
jgi:hypothetical protein